MQNQSRPNQPQRFDETRARSSVLDWKRVGTANAIMVLAMRLLTLQTALRKERAGLMLKPSSGPLRNTSLARCFLRHDKGAAAVEFALVLVPFLVLLFMTMETAMVFLAQQSLETAVADASRLVLTGQAENLNADAFKEKICAKGYVLFDCNALYVDVQSYGSAFSSISSTIQYDDAGNPETQFSPGKASEVAVVRLIYQWPITLPWTKAYLADSDSTKRLLVATAAFRNEP